MTTFTEASPQARQAMILTAYDGSIQNERATEIRGEIIRELSKDLDKLPGGIFAARSAAILKLREASKPASHRSPFNI